MCAGVFNRYQNGPKKKEVAMYAKHTVSLSSQRWCVSSYCGLPSIVSRKCINTGVRTSKDGTGQVCKDCYDMREARENSNPSVALNRCIGPLMRAVERRDRSEITECDYNDAKGLIQKTSTIFTLDGEEIMQEVRGLVDYYEYLNNTQIS